jgi:hypothetical protein
LSFGVDRAAVDDQQHSSLLFHGQHKAGDCYWTEGVDGWRFGRSLAYEKQNRAAEMAVPKEILAAIWKF